MRGAFPIAAVMVMVNAIPSFAQAPKFNADDPLWTMPKPLPVTAVKLRRISDIYDVFYTHFAQPGEHQPVKGPPVLARGVNTLGEVPDGEWYVNRHYRHRMSLAQLRQGPAGDPPSRAGKWTVVAAKTEGVTPGFTIVDSTGQRFIIKFDPADHPELATAADVIGSRFFHALGYLVPANRIVHFTRDDLELGPDTTVTDRQGQKRKMTSQDLWDVLGAVHKEEDGTYRAVASLYLTGKPVGPRRWHGTRRDDPNDIVPHEHRRDLRGMRVFAAWLGHDDSRAINSLDMLVDDGVPHIKHYLIDFGSTLGSASDGPNSPRSGHVPFFSWTQTAQEFLTLGLYVPKWSLAKYPKFASVGRFEHQRFDPVQWTPEYRNAAFENMLPDDAFWAAKQVASFSDEEIRAIVRTGQLSDAKAEEWLVECLIKRRDKVARAFLTKVLPLDNFRIEGGRLTFDDLGVRAGSAAQYAVQWSRINVSNGAEERIQGAAGPSMPQTVTPRELLVAHVASGDARTIRVYVRFAGDKPQVVGLKRTWLPTRAEPESKLAKSGANN